METLPLEVQIKIYKEMRVTNHEYGNSLGSDGVFWGHLPVSMQEKRSRELRNTKEVTRFLNSQVRMVEDRLPTPTRRGPTGRTPPKRAREN